MLYLVLVLIVLYPEIAWAQEVGAQVSSTDFVTGITDVIAAFQKNWMLGLSSLFSFVGTVVLRVPIIARFLDSVEDWIRPLIGVVAAFGFGYLGSLSMGGNYLEALGPGLLAGGVGGWWNKLIVAIETEPTPDLIDAPTEPKNS